MKSTGILLLPALLLFASHLPARADDWPSAFHDPANTGVSVETIHPPLRLAWTARAAGFIGQFPVAASGLLIVPGSGGLVALHLDGGTRAWKVPGKFHETYLTDGTVYSVKTIRVEDRDRDHLLAVDAGTGKIRWDVLWEGDGTEPSQSLTGITGYQQHLYLTDGKSRLIEFDPANGKEVRATQFPAWSMGLPAFSGDYAFWGGGHVLATLSLPAWQTTTWGIWDGGNSFPIVWQDYLAIQGPINTTQVYRLQDGKPTFLYRCYGEKGVGHGIAPVGDGLLLSRSDNPAGYLAARNLADGKIRWQAPMDVTGLCSAAGEYVYVCGQNRKRNRRGQPIGDRWQDALFVIRARDGKISAKYPLPRHSSFPPVIVDGHVIVAAGNEMRCYTAAGR